MGDMSDTDDHKVTFRVVGKQVLNGHVLADVFARKLAIFVKAMEAADRSANGQKHFDYVIVDLKATSAAAVVQETRSNRAVPQFSSAETFGDCMRAIDDARYEVARRHMECVTYIAAMAKDADKTFDHIQVTVNGFEPIIADKVFLARAQEATRLPDKQSWFRGTAIATFDGTVVVEDIRDISSPRLVLRLTAGGKEIECHWLGFSSEEHHNVLGKRVRVQAKAHYDGKSGLPVRLDILQAPTLIKPKPDFLRWGSTFRPFDVSDWEGDH